MTIINDIQTNFNSQIQFLQQQINYLSEDKLSSCDSDLKQSGGKLNEVSILSVAPKFMQPLKSLGENEDILDTIKSI